MKKEHIKHALEAYLPELTAMADQIYDLAELEWKSSSPANYWQIICRTTDLL